MLVIIVAALFGLLIALAVIGLASFVIAAIVTVTWNVVFPYFGGPAITFWVAYAGYWLLAIILMLLRGGIDTSSKTQQEKEGQRW